MNVREPYVALVRELWLAAASEVIDPSTYTRIRVCLSQPAGTPPYVLALHARGALCVLLTDGHHLPADLYQGLRRAIEACTPQLVGAS